MSLSLGPPFLSGLARSGRPHPACNCPKLGYFLPILYLRNTRSRAEAASKPRGGGASRPKGCTVKGAPCRPPLLLRPPAFITVFIYARGTPFSPPLSLVTTDIPRLGPRREDGRSRGSKSARPFDHQGDGWHRLFYPQSVAYLGDTLAVLRLLFWHE